MSLSVYLNLLRYWEFTGRDSGLPRLPEKLVLYCGRHDYGTRVLQGSGNLAVVMRTMGHGSPTTAMKYQHPELEQVRRVLNGTNSNHDPERGNYGTLYGTVTN